MAKIKSTIDIIMEKTKSMNLTSEEKAELRLREWKGKIRGLVQRYCDNMIHEKDIEKELFEKEGADRPQLQNILRREVLNRLDPDNDNERLFQLVRFIPGTKRDLIEKKMSEFRNIRDNERARRISEIKRELSEKGISGSAITPNLEADSQWKAFSERALDIFRKEILDQER